MSCCIILAIIALLFFLMCILIGVYLFRNNFRIMYFDLTKFFNGREIPEKVGSYYDEWNDRYLETYGDTIQSYRTEDLNELHAYIAKSAGLKDGMRILDAGCGFGGPAMYFAEHHDIQIEALTISQKQMDILKHNIDIAKLTDKISAKCGDFHDLDKIYNKESFDAVLFLESFGHAWNPKKLLKAAAGVLKTGSYIYIKDYFKKDMPDDRLQKKLIKMGLKNMDDIYRYNTPDLYHTIYLMRKLNFELRSLKIPDFSIEKWDKNKVIQSFHQKNNIAFYNNKDHLFDQKNGRFIVDPYEMIFVKR
ncbi:MAG: class I SAM-dependent methyltransferase [Bacteroidales bacterium]|nr:class I SAM-dependent methyltransferase [Bacteroidales bacterium]